MNRIALMGIGCMLLSCGLNDRWKETNDRIDKLGGVVATSFDAVALAVPGERYQRLIADAHGSDPEKKAAAQAFIESLFQVDADAATGYVVTIWVDTSKVPQQCLQASPRGPLLDAFVGSSPSGAEVEQYLASRALNLAPATAVAQIDTEATRQAALAKALAPILEDIDYDPQTKFQAPVQACAHAGNPQAIVECGKRIVPDRAARFSKAVAAAVAAFESKSVTIGAQAELVRSWNLISEAQTLFIVIDEESWTCMKDTLKLTALVHLRSSPAAPYNQLAPYEFPLPSFDDKAEEPKTRRRIRWGVHNMTGHALINQRTLDQIDQTRQLLKNWEQLQPARQKKGK